MAKVPLKTLANFDDPKAINRMQDHVEEAINKLGTQTQDNWADGVLFKRVLGVGHDNLLTNSGIAAGTITGSKLAFQTVTGGNIALGSVSGVNLVAATVTTDKLAACNQFSVYRDAAFTCPAGAYSALYANQVVKDSAGGWDASHAWYVIPTAGDWWFTWSAGMTFANSGKLFQSVLVVNSGVIFGTDLATGGATGHIAGGSYLYCNAQAGDRVKVQVFNGDVAGNAMLVTSGNNQFQGYQVR